MRANGDGAEDAGDRDEARALSALLHAERAAVAVTAALASGATTHLDRMQLERIGGELVLLCCALRERLDLAGNVPPPDSASEAGVLLATESYDARLSAQADFLDGVANQATAALGAANDGEPSRTLRDLIAAHARAAQWLRERAAAFAATRPHSEPPYDAGAVDVPEAPTGTAHSGVDEQPATGKPPADDVETP